MKVIKIINMNKSYQDNIIFDKFNFEVEENTFNVVMGVSGSGKSTLLNIIGLLDKADSGDVILFGEKNIKPFSRLLLKQCDLILSDEPTGSLDESNREIIIKLLKRMQDSGKTIVVVSHDPVFKDIADQIIYLN